MRSKQGKGPMQLQEEELKQKEAESKESA